MMQTANIKHHLKTNSCVLQCRTHVFAEAVLLQQALHQSALHGREKVLRVEGAEAGPAGEESVGLPPDGGRRVGQLQQRQVRLLHAFEHGHVLPLRAQHPAPEQVELTERERGKKKKMSE